MNTSNIKRKAKINLLQWRIKCVQRRLDKCPPCTPESRALLYKFVTLIQTRNNLHTPAEVDGIEKERGLV